MTSLCEDLTEYFKTLAVAGGPQEVDYSELTRRIFVAHAAVKAGLVKREAVIAAINTHGAVSTTATMQGFALCKPHGYAGDYEIIDRIYTEWVSDRPELAAWDRYFHAQAAPRAVRNRKAYFHHLLDGLKLRPGGARVLKLGSGPGRGMYEWLRKNTGANVQFECVEVDPGAVAYARRLNEQHLDRIIFHVQNVFRFRPDREYDLVWAAGLFDYFDDRVFINVGRRVWPSVVAGGEMVIGNFARMNPSRAYMELIGDWRLHHRTQEELRQLVIRCGADPSLVRVDSEPEGVNLFVHASRAGSSLELSTATRPRRTR